MENNDYKKISYLWIFLSVKKMNSLSLEDKRAVVTEINDFDFTNLNLKDFLKSIKNSSAPKWKLVIGVIIYPLFWLWGKHIDIQIARFREQNNEYWI